MKVALVTGAYRGLGLEFCQQLVKEGYHVLLTARDIRKAEVAADQLIGDRALVYPKALEVTDESQLAALAVWVEEQFGKIDLIVNNAGVNPKDYSDKARMAKTFYLDQLDAREVLDVIHVNSLAPLLVVKHFRQLLKQSEHPIVLNISSWLGSVSTLAFGGHYGYVGSKNVLNIFNKSMANELRPDGIICINVNPGWVQTDMGGKKAAFTTEQAVRNIMNNVINKVTPGETGKFLNYDGAEHPW